ncbi:hypothetical protein A5739_08810 [Mycobacterium colombiense]|uniref:hypothetical protein n=1 Tax=Mycobacterium colombiense TaxID=339268 RepID=UPI00096E63DF|nr:hypothetical protein [Mycobacterium colombiense]OMC33431.1 hypothetical protein A5739_08810 [Mycobacterium colombiense]
MVEVRTELVRSLGVDPINVYAPEGVLTDDPEGRMIFIPGIALGELVINNRVVTPSGAALLWGIPLRNREREKISESLASDSVPMEWVQAGTRRAKEAREQANGPVDDILFATLEYWARKDYDGRLEVWPGGSIHLVREMPDDWFGAQ